MPALSLGALMGDIESVSGDASFRRYFRGRTASVSVVLVDAPPEKENSRPFVEVATRLQSAGVRAPRVLAVDFALGFMCLEDFGDQLLWPALEAARLAADFEEAGRLYQQCLEELLLIQRAEARTPPLPHYDDALLQRELHLFSEWFCAGLLKRPLDKQETALVEALFAFLCREVQQQVQVFVHRDYHSRNLMLLQDGSIGVIDFQDAVLGPITYDLVSLFKDCYIEWPRSQVNEWALQFAEQAHAVGLLATYNERAFLRDFDLMGAQRHLKVLGIFSRLWLRDGKSGYLKDIPLTFRYLQQVMKEQPECKAFAQWLEVAVVPHLPAALARETQRAREQGVLK